MRFGAFSIGRRALSECLQFHFHFFSQCNETDRIANNPLSRGVTIYTILLPLELRFFFCIVIWICEPELDEKCFFSKNPMEAWKVIILSCKLSRRTFQLLFMDRSAHKALDLVRFDGFIKSGVCFHQSSRCSRFLIELQTFDFLRFWKPAKPKSSRLMM